MKLRALNGFLKITFKCKNDDRKTVICLKPQYLQNIQQAISVRFSYWMQ